MADVKNLAKNGLGLVNSIISALEFVHPDEDSTSIYLSDKGRLNILNFLVDLFGQIKGPDWLTTQISHFIVQYIPYLEYSVKLIILGYIESMMSCSVKPFITEKMILDGVYFDLQSIDLFNMLNNEPVICSLKDINESSKPNEDTISDITNVNDNKPSIKDKPGRYLYFGCHPEFGIHTIPDLVKCRDFNAFLWYTKNCPGTRNIWQGDMFRGMDPIIRELNTNIQIHKVKQTVGFNGHQIEVTRICREGVDENGNTVYYTLTNELVTPGKNGFQTVTHQDVAAYAKQGKRNGIVTLEYNAKSSGLTDAEHNPMAVNEPLQNCLHVFIGCCAEIQPEEKKLLNFEISNIQKDISDLSKLKDDINSLFKELDEVVKEYKKDKSSCDNKKVADCETAKQNLLLFYKNITNINDKNIIDMAREIFKCNSNVVYIKELEGRKKNSFTIPQTIINTNQAELEQSMKRKNAELTMSRVGTYPSAKSNYYYMHPLLEFNTDLIFSMKWFDEKVIAAQLINAITGCFEFNEGNLNANGLLSYNISLQNKILQSELNDLIERIIENDDDTVNDCFFTFDNDKFNRMMQASEMNRIGLFTMDGENAMSTVSPSEVMAAINALSPEATKEELSTAIEHSIFSAISSKHSKIDSIEYKLSVNGALGDDFNTNVNIFEVLIKKLVYVIVSTFLMPKIYMIIMFNLKLLENGEGSFDLMQYITYCKSMFVDIIKGIKEQIIEYFKKILMDILNEILKLFKPMILKEQYMYYKELITSCVECLKIHGNEYEWAQDAVNYADIMDPITSIEDEC